MADSDPGSPLTDRDDAECWASKVVGAIGDDRLGELGITADAVGDVGDYAFNDDEIGVVVDALDDCINLRDVLAEQFEEDFGAEAAGCVADEMSGGLLKDAMRAGFTDSDPSADFLQSFLDIAAKCDVPLS
jgi:hypothetical protein